ncbi:MAG: class I SAM-dependent methyltransferase, partial [Patescibacteria group bacterium]|nr:class I SAM-dependent methyltransferase [Patescibacteria group bacterium]
VTPENFFQCLREFHRILKPGGRFINLETSQPSVWIIKKLFHLYVGLMIKPLGAVISGAPAAYAYLAATIPRFYNAEDLAEIIRKAGFSRVTYNRMFFGIAAIHKAIK